MMLMDFVYLMQKMTHLEINYIRFNVFHPISDGKGGL